jgi:DNA-binding NarL/FixJ family response regulator
MAKIKIVIVEDNSSLRSRLVEQFSFYEDVVVVGSYATGEAALNGLQKLPSSKLPSIVLMDIGLPKMSGIETTIALKEMFPEIDVMMITVFEDDTKIFQSIQAGATGYLLKDDPPDRILGAIRELSKGGSPMSQSIARKVMAFVRDQGERGTKATSRATASDPTVFALSDREVELLRGLVQGDTYSSLSKRLFISPHTVKTHIKNIYKKLHVHSRATAVRVALERKLV